MASITVAPANMRIEDSPRNALVPMPGLSNTANGPSHASSSSTQAKAPTAKKGNSKRKTALLEQLKSLHPLLVERHDRLTDLANDNHRVQQPVAMALAMSLTDINYLVDIYRDEVGRRAYYERLAEDPEGKISTLVNDMEKTVGKLDAMLGGMVMGREMRRQEERQIEQERQMDMQMQLQIEQEMQTAANQEGSGVWFGGCTIL